MEFLKPTVNLCQKDICALEGSELRVEGEIIGQTDSKIKWQRNEQPLEESERVQILLEGNKLVLVIKDIKKDEAGTYKVVVNCGADEVSDTCQVTIKSSNEVEGGNMGAAAECPAQINTIVTPPTPDLAKGEKVFQETTVVDGIGASSESKPISEATNAPTANIEAAEEALEQQPKAEDTSAAIKEENLQNQLAEKDSETAIPSLEPQVEISAIKSEEQKGDNAPATTEIQASSENSAQEKTFEIKVESSEPSLPNFEPNKIESPSETKTSAETKQSDIRKEVPCAQAESVKENISTEEEIKPTEAPKSDDNNQSQIENVKTTEDPKSEINEALKVEEQKSELTQTPQVEDVKTPETPQENTTSAEANNVEFQISPTEPPKHETPQGSEIKDAALDSLPTLLPDESKIEAGAQPKDTQISESQMAPDLPTTIADTCQLEVTSLLTQALEAVDNKQNQNESSAAGETPSPTAGEVKSETTQTPEAATTISSPNTDSSAVPAPAPQAQPDDSQISSAPAEIKPTPEQPKEIETKQPTTSGEEKIEGQINTAVATNEENKSENVKKEAEVKASEATAPLAEQGPEAKLAETCPKPDNA
uniref:Ig-like domain-containing protein n=1 Tax=Musca domestica TaxID=7370 RepID=T1PCE3_MUSDO